ncbi:MAG: hypothetical protein JST22_01105 [Bacteroidetes bacterium]|nr:hypothetical protein [Bacteroidota bacterium]
MMNIRTASRRIAAHVLLLHVVALGCAFAQGGALPELRATTIKGRDFPLRADSGRVAVIFYTPSTCRECAQRLDLAVRALKGTDSVIRVVVLANVGADTNRQRQALNDARTLVSAKPPVVFDVPAGAVFGRYGVSKTPALLLLGRDLKVPVFVSYDAMFGSATPALTSDADIESLDTLLRSLAAAAGK